MLVFLNSIICGGEIERQEGILLIQKIEENQFQISYNLKSIQQQENSILHTLNDSLINENNKRIRIYSFNQNYADHIENLDFEFPDDKENILEYEILQKEKYADLVIRQDANFFTILIYRYDEIDHNKKLYSLEPIFEKKIGKQDQVNYKGIKINEYYFDENDKLIEKISKKKKDIMICSTSSKIIIKLPIVLHFQHIDEETGERSEQIVNIHDPYQAWIPPYYLVNSFNESSYFQCQYLHQEKLFFKIFLSNNRFIPISAEVELLKKKKENNLLKVKFQYKNQNLSFCESQNEENFDIQQINQIQSNIKIIIGDQTSESLFIYNIPNDYKFKSSQSIVDYSLQGILMSELNDIRNLKDLFQQNSCKISWKFQEIEVDGEKKNALKMYASLVSDQQQQIVRQKLIRQKSLFLFKSDLISSILLQICISLLFPSKRLSINFNQKMNIKKDPEQQTEEQKQLALKLGDVNEIKILIDRFYQTFDLISGPKPPNTPPSQPFQKFRLKKFKPIIIKPNPELAEKLKQMRLNRLKEQENNDGDQENMERIKLVNEPKKIKIKLKRPIKPPLNFNFKKLPKLILKVTPIKKDLQNVNFDKYNYQEIQKPVYQQKISGFYHIINKIIPDYLSSNWNVNLQNDGLEINNENQQYNPKIKCIGLNNYIKQIQNSIQGENTILQFQFYSRFYIEKEDQFQIVQLKNQEYTQDSIINLSELFKKDKDYDQLKILLFQARQQSCFVNYLNEDDGNIIKILLYDNYSYFSIQNDVLIQDGQLKYKWQRNNAFSQKRSTVDKMIECQSETDIENLLDYEIEFNYKLQDQQQNQLLEQFSKEIWKNKQEQEYHSKILFVQSITIPEKIKCFIDLSQQEFNIDEKKIKIWLIDSTKYFRQVILYYFKNQIIIQNMIFGKIDEEFQKTEIKKIDMLTYLEGLDLHNFTHYERNKLNFNILANINDISKHSTNIIDQLQQVILPTKYYDENYIQEEEEFQIFVHRFYGGVFFYFMKPLNDIVGNFYFVLSLDQNEFHFHLKNISQENKMISMYFPKPSIVMTPKDIYKLEIQIIDESETLSNNIAPNFIFNLETKLTYGIFQIPNFDITQHELILDESQENNYSIELREFDINIKMRTQIRLI